MRIECNTCEADHPSPHRIRVPVALFADDHLSNLAVVVAVVIADIGVCWMATRTLAGRVGRSRSQVSRALTVLRDTGWITDRENGGVELVWPADAVPTTVPSAAVYCRDRVPDGHVRVLAAVQHRYARRLPLSARALGGLPCLSKGTVERALPALCRSGWLQRIGAGRNASYVPRHTYPQEPEKCPQIRTPPPVDNPGNVRKSAQKCPQNRTRSRGSSKGLVVDVISSGDAVSARAPDDEPESHTFGTPGVEAASPPTPDPEPATKTAEEPMRSSETRLSRPNRVVLDLALARDEKTRENGSQTPPEGYPPEPEQKPPARIREFRASDDPGGLADRLRLARIDRLKRSQSVSTPEAVARSRLAAREALRTAKDSSRAARNASHSPGHNTHDATSPAT